MQKPRQRLPSVEPLRASAALATVLVVALAPGIAAAQASTVPGAAPPAASTLPGTAAKSLAAPGVKLLPAERAFRLAARSLDPATLEARFIIAPGYYMYRDKMRFKVEPGSASVPAAELPPGKPKDDPFFGRVDIYRDEVVVRLPVTGSKPGEALTLIAESQGCADAGVCYPPNVQKLAIALPRTAGAPGKLIEAHPMQKGWLQ
jgi:thiol:disulfide interchange protein